MLDYSLREAKGLRPSLCIASCRSLIARSEAWEGDVERFDSGEGEVSAGQIDARFGRNTLRFVDGTFRVSIAQRERPQRSGRSPARTAPPPLMSSSPRADR